MTKLFPKMKTLVSRRTRTFVAVIFLALICSSLICVSAQRKEKSAQTKKEAIKAGAADQLARRRADALLAQMTLDERSQLNQVFFFSSLKGKINERRDSKGGRFITLRHRSGDNKPLSEIAVTESRLKIPPFGFDVTVFTIFPVLIGIMPGSENGRGANGCRS